MIGLVIAEFSAYLSVTTESKVILDHFDSSADDTLQVLNHKTSSFVGANWTYMREGTIQT